MHNHTHIVVKVDQQRALAWDKNKVIDQWTTLYKPTPIVARHLTGIKRSKAEQAIVNQEIKKWRHRLYDISWFMRNLKFNNWNAFYTHNPQIMDKNHSVRNSFGLRCKDPSCTFEYA
jgi:hypothetical protein